MRKGKSRGFTLIELIVVMAIIGIAGTIAVFSLNAIFSQNVKQCANEINGSIGQTKITTMSKSGNVYLWLYRAGDGIHAASYENGALISDTMAGKSTVSVTYSSDACGSYSALSDASLDAAGIVLAFDKETGSFLNIGQSGTLKDPHFADAGDMRHFTNIIISGAGKIMTITLTSETGKYTMAG